MNELNSWKYDVIFCIDSSMSMTPFIKNVRKLLQNICQDLQEESEKFRRSISFFRVKIIGFRDYYTIDGDPISISPYFFLPDQKEDFNNYIQSNISLKNDGPSECGLEALALAIKSNWINAQPKCRKIIMIFTDTTAYPLEKQPKPAIYPGGIAKTFDELTDQWMGQKPLLDMRHKRLVLFAPDLYPWSQISEYWENTIHYPEQAGNGLSESDYRSIIEILMHN